jgi:hypothetical protein
VPGSTKFRGVDAPLICSTRRMETQRSTGKRKSANRGPKNLSLPAELRARLAAASEATGIPESRIAEQGLRLRLAQLDAAQPNTAPMGAR